MSSEIGCVMETRHLDYSEALTYVNIGGILGKKLQSDTFGGTFKENPADNVTNSKNRISGLGEIYCQTTNYPH